MPRSLIAPFRPLRRVPAPPRPSLGAGTKSVVALSLGALAALTVPARAADTVPATGSPSLVDIISHTPIWVWLILAGLIWLGLGRTRDREVGIVSLIGFPLILVALSFFNLFGGSFGLAGLGGAAVGALLGLACGIELERRLRPSRIAPDRLFVPGDWSSLVVVLVVFLTRYVKSVAAVVDPLLAQSEGFVAVTSGLSTLFAVMLLTRTVLRLRLILIPVAA